MQTKEVTLDRRQKKQLTVNILLMVLTLFTLICCVLAWFSSSNSAHIQNLNLAVSRTDVELLSPLTKIEFPCATNLHDCTQTEFVNDCAVVKDYIVAGVGQVHVDVECHGDGMLAYICPSSTAEDYYTSMITDLSNQLQDMGKTDWTYDNLKQALVEVNNRYVGDTVSFGGEQCTQFRVVYWVAYTDGAQTFLEQDGYQESEYTGADQGTSDYYAKITVTGM